MYFVDSHCHLTYKRDDTLTPQKLVANAKQENVKTLLSICTTNAEFPTIHEHTMAEEGVYCTYGIHPHHAGEELNPQELEASIRQAVKLPKVVSLGEAGLDYYYDHAPKDVQKEIFRTHLKLAQELDLPLVIHSRDAEEDTIMLLAEAINRGPLKAVIHCFTSKPNLADFAVEHGLYLGATGVITFKKSQDLRDIFARMPLERILIETDSPYLAPTPYRGKPNQPAYVVHVAECLAEVRGIPIKEVAEQTTRNFFTLFDRIPKPAEIKG